MKSIFVQGLRNDVLPRRLNLEKHRRKRVDEEVERRKFSRELGQLLTLRRKGRLSMVS